MSTQPTKRIRRRRPGDLGQLRAVLWEVLIEIEAIVKDPATDKDRKLKGASALATLAGAYLKALEAHELLPRLEALEAALGKRQDPTPKVVARYEPKEVGEALDAIWEGKP